MSFLIVPLLILGTVLTIVEIFIPGFGFFGISGIICIVVSSIYTILYVPFGLAIVAGEILLIGIGIWRLIMWAKSRQLYGSLILKDILSSEKQETGNLDALIGKEGVTVVPLRPFGSVLFNGVKTDAFSEGPYIPKGRTVTVINVENDRIIVRESN